MKKTLNRLPMFGFSFKQHFLNLLSDLRTTLLWIFPCVILFSLLVFIIGLTHYFVAEHSEATQLLQQLHYQAHTLFGYLLTAAITFTVAMRYKQPRPPLVLLSLCYLGSYQFLAQYYPNGYALEYLIAILTPIYTVPFIAWLQSIKLLHRKIFPYNSNQFSYAISLVIPAIVVMLLVLLVNKLILITWHAFPSASITLENIQNAPYWYGSLFSLISAISHFMGIHSIYTLPILHEPMFDALIQNIQNHQQGIEQFNSLNWTTAPVFALLGGSGSTFALIIAVLLVCKQKTLRTIAMISIPLGYFNVNEILIFGIPVMFNPILLIPFLLAPTVNICIAIFAIEIGLVDPTVTSVQFVSPMFINAYMATNGDINAVILQLFCLVISTCIYLPFVKRLDQVYTGVSIYFPKFDTYYSRKQEEASVLNEDIVAKTTDRLHKTAQLEQHLKFISEIEFHLEYQPQYALLDNQIVGAEALIRASDEKGNRYLPISFLPWLENAGLMKDLDLWVFQQVIIDVKNMKENNVDARISVNISADTLLDKTSVNSIIDLIVNANMKNCLNIEITEKSLLLDENAIRYAFKRFHEHGVYIHIDDFGTGYSSLSYLSKFDIDQIKIDRSFVLGIESEKGKNLFLSLFDIAASQNLGVVVEGVETKEQIALIPKKQNIHVQGWYFSHASDLHSFIAHYSNVHTHQIDEDAIKQSDTV